MTLYEDSESSEEDFDVQKSGLNILDFDETSCVYNDTITAVLKTKTDPSTHINQTQYDVTISLTMRDILKLGGLVRFMRGSNMTVRLSNSALNFDETFVNHSLGYEVPLGYSLRCHNLGVIELVNTNEESNWTSLNVEMHELTMQAFIFTGTTQKFNFPIDCLADLKRAYIALPIVLTCLAVLIPLLTVVKAIKSVKREKKNKQMELNKDLYALRMGFLNAMRNLVATLRAQICRRRFNSA